MVRAERKKHKFRDKVYEPTLKMRKKVRSLAATGYLQHEIAAYMQISVTTLLKHYRKQLDRAEPDMLSIAQATLNRNARLGDNDAAKFILSRKGSDRGWGNRQEVAQTIQHSFDLSQLSDDELDEFEKLQKKASKKEERVSD